jgi:hypothetical protein
VSVIHDRMRRDYPLLWEKAGEYDFAERLGGCSDPLMAEIDEAMREIFSARTFMADFSAPPQSPGSAAREGES